MARMLIPRSARVWNIVAAIPALVRMPDPDGADLDDVGVGEDLVEADRLARFLEQVAALGERGGRAR